MNINTKWITEYNKSDNIDSIALWDKNIFVTSKSSNNIHVYDLDGYLIGKFGEDVLKRPNGIIALQNILFVVERDNHRVHMFSLPDLKSIGIIGEDVLKYPYGITGYYDGNFIIYVTDQKDLKVYKFVLYEDTYDYYSFGCKLGKLESILVDRKYNRLLVADEKYKNIKIYDLDGKYVGVINGLFCGEPEGIVLSDYGFYIFTDQDKVKNTFHIVSRDELLYIDSFYSHDVKNTDGIAIDGDSFYAIHDDGSLSAFDLQDILNN